MDNNKCKRENNTNHREETEDKMIEYTYGIVTTGDSWIFTILTSENNLAATTQSMVSLPILDSRLKDSGLMDRV